MDNNYLFWESYLEKIKDKILELCLSKKELQIDFHIHSNHSADGKQTVKEIIELIKVTKSDLKNNFTIKESYIGNLVGAELNFEDEDINLFTQYFRLETGRFDIKKLFQFDSKIASERVILLTSGVLPKMKGQIIHSEYKSFKLYLKPG